MGWLRSRSVVFVCLCLAGLVSVASATAKSYPQHWFRTPDNGVGLTFCEWNYYTGKAGNRQTELSCYHEHNKQGAFVNSRAQGYKARSITSLPYPNTIKQGRFTLTQGIHVHIYKVGTHWRVAAWESIPATSQILAYSYFIVGPGILNQQTALCGRHPYPCSPGEPH